MTAANSTTPAPTAKPAKPYPDYPLFAHASGQWAKKIRGKLHYFGTDPDAALAKYLEQKDALHAGRAPRPQSDGLTVKELCNAFLNHKAQLRDEGRLLPATWAEYKEACDLIVTAFGRGRLVDDLGPDDFAALRKVMAKRWGLARLKNSVQRVRSTFKFARDNGLTARPPLYGQGFQMPSKKEMRLHRARQGPKLFSAEEVRALAGGALVVGPDGPALVRPGAQLRAMILLGINCGFGNADCGRLPLSALDLDNAVIDYPRPKTGINRRCPLWPETVQALKEALARRPAPKREEHAGLVFITKYGLPWEKAGGDNAIGYEVAKLLRRLGINGRKRLGLYTLRHTFRTVADAARDQPAADFMMGHCDGHISEHYREAISDDRLRAVSDHVRAWLWPKELAAAPAIVASGPSPRKD
jgi:integrase